MLARNYLDFYEAYKKSQRGELSQAELPGMCYFIDDETILSIPRDDGDARYPYGEKGFNFWAYTSGYMHSNEGLFSPFLRAAEGAEPKIAFFGRSHNAHGEIEEIFSLLSVPVDGGDSKGVERYCIFAPEAAYYGCVHQETLFTMRVFVNDDHQLYISVDVQPLGEEPHKPYDIAFFINPYLKHGLMENSTDRWFRDARYKEDEGEPVYWLTTYEEKDRGLMTAHEARLDIQWNEGQPMDLSATTSRYQFVGGSRSSLHTPEGLGHPRFAKSIHETSFTEHAIWGGIVHNAYGETSCRLDFKMGYGLFDEAIKPLWSVETLEEAVLGAYNTCKMEHERFYWHVEEGQQPVDFIQPAMMNGFVQQLKKQVAFCSTIKGYIQLSDFSLIGIRDIFQALEAYLYWHPTEARNKMLEALSFIDESGWCPRQYALPFGNKKMAMDLRPFIDQGVWVITTIVTYLKVTKDWSFLEALCGYVVFDDRGTHKAHVSDKKSTVLTHLVEIMNVLLSNQDELTGCIHALYGDWNDALDGLGKTSRKDREFGTGVSVMATLQVYQNLNEMLELLSREEVRTGQEDIDIDALSSDYSKARERIIKGLYANAFDMDKIVHGWGDEQSYYVGSYSDPDGKARDGLTSYAFWVLSGMYHEPNKQSGVYDQERLHHMILDAFERLDSVYGLKTFEPAFSMGTQGVGRIPNLPAGTAENGATYIHASMFGVMALFRMGESKKAYEQLYKLLPMTHKSISVSPFVLPNSYGHNTSLNIDGESMQDWQTGSSNVLMKIIIGDIIGFKPTYDGVQIQPASYQPYKTFECLIPYAKGTLVIRYRKVAGCTTRRYTYKGITDEEEGIFIHDAIWSDIEGQHLCIQIEDPM